MDIDAAEQILIDHALVAVTTDERHREVHHCQCGTKHPAHDDGRWPTHRRHVARALVDASND